MEVDGEGWAGLHNLPDDLISLANLPDWDADLERFVSSLVEAGQALEHVVNTPPSQDAPFDPLAAGAMFLEEHQASVKMFDVSGASPSNAVAVLERVRLHEPAVARVIRYMFRTQRDTEPPTAASRQVFQGYLRDTLRRIDWKEDGQALLAELRWTLVHLRMASTKSVLMKKSGQPAWHAAAIFLTVWHSRERQRADPMSRLSPWEIEQWLPELFPVAPSRATAPKSSDPLDIRLTCDLEARVYTPGSGQTRKDGSRRDNRGHH